MPTYRSMGDRVHKKPTAAQHWPCKHEEKVVYLSNLKGRTCVATRKSDAQPEDPTPIALPGSEAAQALPMTSECHSGGAVMMHMADAGRPACQ